MALIRVTFFFQNDLAAGWTETLYSQRASISEAMNDALTLYPLRVAMLGGQVRLLAYRGSDDLVKRDSQFFSVPTDSQFNKNASVADIDSDIASTCLVIRCQAADNIHRRTLSLRGIPDNVVQQGGRFVPTAGFASALQSWALRLSLQGWCIRGKDATFPVNSIIAISQNPATFLVTITTAAPHGLAANNQIDIRSVRGATSINGNWQVFSTPSDTTFTIFTRQIINVWAGNGTVQKVSYTLYPMFLVQAVRASHRLAGRAFFVSRGRRRARTPR